MCLTDPHSHHFIPPDGRLVVGDGLLVWPQLSCRRASLACAQCASGARTSSSSTSCRSSAAAGSSAAPARGLLCSRSQSALPASACMGKAPDTFPTCLPLQAGTPHLPATCPRQHWPGRSIKARQDSARGLRCPIISSTSSCALKTVMYMFRVQHCCSVWGVSEAT